MSYQPTAPPPPPGTITASQPVVPAKIRPSKAWYWIGALLIAAGVLTSIGLLIGWAKTVSDAVDNFARVLVPPEGQEVALDFKKTGEYRIYYEWRSEADGQRVDTDNDPPSDLQITMTGPDGQPVEVEPDDEDFAFSFNDKLGQAVAKVDITAPGTYTMQVQSNATEPFVISVGKGVLQTIWPWWLLGIIGAFVVGVALGLVAIITTAVRRGRRKRDLRREQLGTGYAVPGAYYPPAAAAPTWTEPPTATPPPSSPGWGAPGAPPPAAPPPGDDPWGPPRA